MADKHIVYAVAELSTDLGTVLQKLPVSRRMDWGEAQDRFMALTGDKVTFPPVKLRHTPIRYFAVRAANDPQWPRYARADIRPRCAKTGRFV